MKEVKNLKLNHLSRGTDGWSSSDLYSISFNYYRDTIESGLLIKTLQGLLIEYEQSREDGTIQNGLIINKLRSIGHSPSDYETYSEKVDDLTNEDFKFIKEKVKRRLEAIKKCSS